MKDPAFLFYTNDFLSGVQDLTMEERGQYITLLCLQHQKGHLTEKMIRLCVGNAAADVMAKFRQDSAGLWYNVRLEQEIQKRAAHGEKQRQRAVEGWEKRKNRENNKPHKSHGNAAAMPLEDVNENRNEDVIEDVIKIGVEGERFVSIAKKYIGDKIIQIFDLKEWFTDQKQLSALMQAGYKDFDGFMNSKPAAMFDDAGHLYNSFLLYHKSKTETNGRKPTFNLKDLKI